MDDTTWFNDWVTLYLEAIGHSERTRATLLAMKHFIVYETQATLAELGEVVSRQVSEAKVPQFPAEVPNALVKELKALRAERNARQQPDFAAVVVGSRCSICGDTGLVAVPHPDCICQPADNPPYLRFYPGTRQVVTGAVLCDRPGCDRGADAREREAKRETKRPRPTLTTYLRRFGNLDVVAMPREHEREQAEAARGRLAESGMADMAALLREIRNRADEQKRRDAA
jgi:hypothetical protein